MERERRGVYGYGVLVEAGLLECVDCGHRYDHPTRALLPPCPRYQDATHPHAGWRVRALERVDAAPPGSQEA